MSMPLTITTVASNQLNLSFKNSLKPAAINLTISSTTKNTNEPIFRYLIITSVF